MRPSTLALLRLGCLGLRATSIEVMPSCTTTETADDNEQPVPWSEPWWQRKLAAPLAAAGPPAAPDPDTGVALAIEYPVEGSITRYDPNLGDVVPRLRLEFGNGWLADLVRANVSAWGLCLSLDGADASCTPLISKPSSATSGLPQLKPDTRRGLHVLRAWLGSTRRGRGPHDAPPHPSAHAVVRFASQASVLGTGCRCVANWFLAAAAPKAAVVGATTHALPRRLASDDPAAEGRGLMAKWWRGMARRWAELAALREDLDADLAAQQLEQQHQQHSGGGIHAPLLPLLPRPWSPLWRYFEMDCVLSALRSEDALVDGAVLQLAGFPAGKLGEKHTPHEYLGKTVNFTTIKHQWMLKLKAPNSVDPDEYRAHVAATLARRQRAAALGHGSTASDAHTNASNAARVEALANGGVPRVVWMHWEQGEFDASLGTQEKLCVEGWRALNPTWEVRLLDATAGELWAPPVGALTEGRTFSSGVSGVSGRPRLIPEGGRVQHKADLLRAYLLACYGGVWADVSVLPLVPLDDWLVSKGLGLTASRRPRAFFAYTFPDPALSWEVSVIPTIYDEWVEPEI